MANLSKIQTSKPWWLRKDKEVAQAIWDQIERLEETQERDYDRYYRHAFLYANDEQCGLDWSIRQRQSGTRGYGRFTINATQSVVDAAAAIIAQNRSVPVVTTDGANWSLQNRARQMSRFLEGTWNRNKVHINNVQVFKDACIFGTGFMKVFDDGDKVGIERVPVYDLRWDEQEGRNGRINTIHQLRWVDAYWLAEQSFVDKKGLEAIAKAVHKAQQCPISYRDEVDFGQVLVVESWRVGTPETPGVHTWTIDGHLLWKEKWDLPRLPFSAYRWRELQVGYAGQGLVQELVPMQIEMNRLSKHVEDCQRMFSNPSWMVPMGSKVTPSQIKNVKGQFIYYTGQRAPSLYTPQAVGQEVYSQIENLYQKMFQKAGISDSHAFGRKPGSLQSAVAVREAVDVETQRFSIQSQGLQDFQQDLAELTISMARKVYGRSKKLEVTYNAERFVETIDWGKNDIVDKPYHVRVQSASILSRTPAGRKQDVIDFVNAGIFTMEEAKQHIMHPDVSAQMDIVNASTEHAEWVVRQLSQGIPVAPEPDMNLKTSIRYVMAERQRAIRGNAPAEIIELMLRFESAAMHLAQQAEAMMMQQQQAAMMAANPPGPQGPEPVAAQGTPMAQPVPGIGPEGA